VPPIIGVSEYRIGFESNFRSRENFVKAPKNRLWIFYISLIGSISVANYFQNGDLELRLLPEIEWTLLGKINVTYGYGIRLNKRESTLNKLRLYVLTRN
jgi:hypothetical protein